MQKYTKADIPAFYIRKTFIHNAKIFIHIIYTVDSFILFGM